MDPSSGRLLNLADCHGREGKTASAWAEFLTAVRMAKHQGDDARWDEAARRAKELEPAPSHVTIKVEARPPGLRVQRDDVTLEDAALSSPIPVDPGQHLVTAYAPGRKRWSKSFRIGANADTQEVVIPALEVEERAALPAASPDAAPTSRSPTAGYVLAGAGAGSAGIGARVGWKAVAADRGA